MSERRDPLDTRGNPGPNIDMNQAISTTSPDTLANVARDRILELIKTGDLKPGAIVNEADLAKQFCMSRGPIREAVRHLEGRKLIVREAHQRAKVTPLGNETLREIFELRACLEGMACRLATLRMGEAEMQRFGLETEASMHPEGRKAYFDDEYKFSFHTYIVEHCGNPRILDMLNTQIYDLIRLYRWTSNATPGRFGESPVEHWQIFRAMHARDAELAESLMRSHIYRASELAL